LPHLLEEYVQDILKNGSSWMLKGEIQQEKPVGVRGKNRYHETPEVLSINAAGTQPQSKFMA
jgi:hypothetical protein